MLGLNPESGGRPDVVSPPEELLGAAGAAAVVVTLDREGSVLLPAPGPYTAPGPGPSRRSRPPGRVIPLSPP